MSKARNESFDETLFRTFKRWQEFAESLEFLRGHLKDGKPGDPLGLVEIMLRDARQFADEAHEEWKAF